MNSVAADAAGGTQKRIDEVVARAGVNQIIAAKAGDKVITGAAIQCLGEVIVTPCARVIAQQHLAAALQVDEIPRVQPLRWTDNEVNDLGESDEREVLVPGDGELSRAEAGAAEIDNVGARIELQVGNDAEVIE